MHPVTTVARWRICGTLVWLLAVSSVPAGPSLPDDPLPPDLLKASQEYDKARLNNDSPALTRLLADNLVPISGSGRAQSKTEFIRDSTGVGVPPKDSLKN